MMSALIPNREDQWRLSGYGHALTRTMMEDACILVQDESKFRKREWNTFYITKKYAELVHLSSSAVTV
jgi:hypothetical protein